MKQRIVQFARKIRILPLLEKINLVKTIIKNHRINCLYVKNNNSKRHYPPYSLMYDAYSHCNYNIYDNTGLQDAKLITEIIRKYTSDTQLVICEFGCGPARIIRNLRQTDSAICSRLIGTDYNPKTVKWCKKNITEIDFIKNELAPPLDLPDSYINDSTAYLFLRTFQKKCTING